MEHRHVGELGWNTDGLKVETTGSMGAPGSQKSTFVLSTWSRYCDMVKTILHDWGKRLTCFHQDLGGLPGHCARPRRPCMPITMDDGPLVRIWWWGPPGRCDGWPCMPITMDGPVLLRIIMWWWAHRAGLMVGLACLLQWPSFVMVGPPGCCDGWPCVPDTMDCPVIMMWWWAPTWPGSGRPCVPVTMGGPVKMWW